jgi:hypothetical protein
MVDIYISERANFPTDEGLRPLVRPECSVISGGGGRRKEEERKERCRLWMNGWLGGYLWGNGDMVTWGSWNGWVVCMHVCRLWDDCKKERKKE